MKIQLTHSYEKLIGVENILAAWDEFVKGKRNKSDVQEFYLHLIDNIISLHDDLNNNTHKHGPYQAFNICDPKPRNIHKASVRDRLLHHTIYRVLYPFFNKTFIADSFSCRNGKGTHSAMKRFRFFCGKASQNNSKTCWVLKCDIRKFFASIDHDILMDILGQYILDKRILSLLCAVIGSFSTDRPGVGLPLGNLTSQLFANIYMNEFDQFVKHKIKAKHYVRYADDFVFLSDTRGWLERELGNIGQFLENRLKISLHPNKVFIKTLASGVDFLGWVHFPDHSVLRTTTNQRMIRNIKTSTSPETFSSYLGMLGHGNAHGLEEKVYRRSLLNLDI